MYQARVLPKITKGKGGQEGDKGQNKWKREQKEEKRKFEKLRGNKKKIQTETKQEVREWMQGQCGNKGDEDKEREARRRRWSKPVLDYEQQEKVSSEPTLYAPTEIK